MKSIIKIISLAAVIVVTIMACDKNEINYGEFDKLTDGQSLIKFNFNAAYRANPTYQIKINGNRVSTLITARYPYPGGGYNTGGDSRPDFLVVNPGTLDVSFTVPKKGTNIDSVVLFRTNVAVAAGKKYTLHVSDTTGGTSTTKSLLLEDDFLVPDTGFCRFKFVHLMPNVGPLDLYNGTTLVKSNIAYLGSSEYFKLPTGTPTATSWTVRAAGSAPTSTAVATYTSASTILNQRIYTVFATGYSGITGTTDVRRPFLSFFLVR